MSNTDSVPPSQVQIELQDREGNIESTFSINPGQSIADAAQDAGADISTACCSGACFVCCCKIKEGQDHIDIGLMGVPLVDIEQDQVLTCVGGIKESLFAGSDFHKIVLQKLI